MDSKYSPRTTVKVDTNDTVKRAHYYSFLPRIVYFFVLLLYTYYLYIFDITAGKNIFSRFKCK